MEQSVVKHCTNLWGNFNKCMLALLGWASSSLPVNTCKPSGLDSHTHINQNTTIPITLYGLINDWYILKLPRMDVCMSFNIVSLCYM